MVGCFVIIDETVKVLQYPCLISYLSCKFTPVFEVDQSDIRYSWKFVCSASSASAKRLDVDKWKGTLNRPGEGQVLFQAWFY